MKAAIKKAIASKDESASAQRFMAAMNAMKAKSATKEGQARAAAADAEKRAMLARRDGSSAPASKPSTPMPTPLTREQQMDKPVNASMGPTPPRLMNTPSATTRPEIAQKQMPTNPSKIGSGGAGQQKLVGMGQAASTPVGFRRSNSAMPTPVANTQPGMNQGSGLAGNDGGAGSGGFKRGGKIKSKSSVGYSSGGSTSKASSRGDGIAQRGKTKGRVI